MVSYGIFLSGRPSLLSLPLSSSPSFNRGHLLALAYFLAPVDARWRGRRCFSPKCHCTPLLCPLRDESGKNESKIPTVTHIFPGLSTHTEWGRTLCPLADDSHTFHPISLIFTVITRPQYTVAGQTHALHPHLTRQPE